jgi:hypothetical protein
LGGWLRSGSVVRSGRRVAFTAACKNRGKQDACQSKRDNPLVWHESFHGFFLLNSFGGFLHFSALDVLNCRYFVQYKTVIKPMSYAK